MKQVAQILLAIVCLVGAGVYCVVLGIGRLVVAVWELAAAFFQEALNTELGDFFCYKDK